MSAPAFNAAYNFAVNDLPEFVAWLGKTLPDVSIDDVLKTALEVVSITRLCFYGEKNYKQNDKWDTRYEIKPLLLFELEDLEDMNPDEVLARFLLVTSTVMWVASPFFGPDGRIKTATLMSYLSLQSYIAALVVLESQCQTHTNTEFDNKNDTIRQLRALKAKLDQAERAAKASEDATAHALAAVAAARQAASDNAQAAADARKITETLEQLFDGTVVQMRELRGLSAAMFLNAFRANIGMLKNFQTALQIANQARTPESMELLLTSVRTNLNIVGPQLADADQAFLGLQEGRLALTNGARDGNGDNAMNEGDQ